MADFQRAGPADCGKDAVCSGVRAAMGLWWRIARKALRVGHALPLNGTPGQEWVPRPPPGGGTTAIQPDRSAMIARAGGGAGPAEPINGSRIPYREDPRDQLPPQGPIF
jgi:hypothetical protein